jgi:hypothetical protein
MDTVTFGLADIGADPKLFAAENFTVIGVEFSSKRVKSMRILPVKIWNPASASPSRRATSGWRFRMSDAT